MRLTRILFLFCFAPLASSHSTTEPDSFGSGSRPSVYGSPFFSLFEPSMIGARQGINHLGLDGYGRILLTSGSSLIAFDGNAWTNYTPAFETDRDDAFTLYCTAISPDGRLYCGSTLGIHRVQFESGNRYSLVALANREEHSEQGVHALRNCLNHGDSIYFYGQGSIAQLDTKTDELTFLQKSLATIGSMASHEGKLYTFGVEGEAFVLRGNDTWQRIDRSPLHTFREGIRVAESWPDVGLMLGPDISSIKLLEDKSGVVAWPSEIDGLESHRVIDIEPISENTLAVSVANAGIFVINREGQIVQALSRSLDHRFGQARKLLHLSNGVIWAISGKSLIRADFLNPLSEASILVPYAITFPRLFWHRGELHVVTDEKLVKADAFKGGALKGFTRRGRSIDSQILNAISVEEGVLCAAIDTVYLLRDDETAVPVAKIPQTTFLARHPDFPDQIVAVGGREYRLIRRKNGVWVPTDIRKPSSGFSYEGKADKNGVFWLEQGVGKVVKLTMREGDFDVATYDEDDGLAAHWTNIWRLGEQISFSTGKDLEFLTWDFDQEAFKPLGLPLTDRLFKTYPGVSRPALDSQGHLWVPTNANHAVIRRQNDGSYVEDLATLAPVQNEVLLEAVPERNGRVWLVGEQRIYLYEPKFACESASLPAPTILGIEDTGANSTLFDSETIASGSPLVLPYGNNSLLIKVTTPTIAASHRVHHQYTIAGRSADWVSFATADSLILNNLYEGEYSLRIRPVHENGTGPETVLTFEISPPFYRSNFAYGAYALCSIGLLLLPTRLLRSRSERRNLALKTLVKLRTRELEVANRELEQLVRRAESATVAKTAFLHNVSHEMRTPLNSIIGPAALMQRVVTDEETLSFVGLIRGAAERLNKIIEELLVFTENEAYNQRQDVSTFHLREILDDLYHEFKADSAAKRVELQTGINPKTPRFWNGDSSKIRQALRILVENAIKFTKTGQVTLSAARTSERDESYLVFEVADSGIGIGPELLKRLFEPFQQGGDDKTGKHEGTGIGLAICQQLVLSMDGRIEVESEVGVGTVFRLTLPLEAKIGHETAAQTK